jgi:acyl carrier protein
MNKAEARILILDALQGIKVLDASRKSSLASNPDEDVQLVSFGIDSVSVMDFCLLIENAIGREVEIVELIDHPSVNTLASHLAEP